MTTNTTNIIAIIAALTGWIHAPDEESYPNIYVLKPDPDRPFKPRFTLRINRDDRLSVSGIYPRYPDRQSTKSYGDPDEPHITCSLSRTPEAIAKDIHRRFIPTFLETHNTRTKRLIKHQEHHTQVTRATTEILNLLRDTSGDPELASAHSTANRRTGKIYVSTRFKHFMAGHIDVSDHVSLDLHSIPLETAKAMLRVLAEHVKNHQRIHISALPAPQRTATMLANTALWNDPYHRAIHEAAQLITQQHPEHTWRYAGQDAATLWYAADNDRLRLTVKDGHIHITTQ